MATEPGAEMRVLTRQECLDLLADQEVGRIAVVLGRRPLIFPVNYVLDGDTIVFRTDAGTKLAAASFEHVAFEVDCIDHRRSWSVLVQGVGHHVTPEFGRVFERVRTLAITSWAPGDKEHWVRVIPMEITGRRLVATESTKG
jgi:nitroimidazol reductase NimA-like FMN-containing flavoprotein (pyridoxamine 5'-phosphate oxidase superfamily)